MSSRIKHPWSYVEIDMLTAAIRDYGRNWKHIHELVLPNITVKGIRDMFYKLSKEDPGFAGLAGVVQRPLAAKKPSLEQLPSIMQTSTAPPSTRDEDGFDWGLNELFEDGTVFY